MIIAPQIMTQEKDQKKAAQKCFDSVGLDPDLYRIGHTKARYFTPVLFSIRFCHFYSLIVRAFGIPSTLDHETNLFFSFFLCLFHSLSFILCRCVAWLLFSPIYFEMNDKVKNFHSLASADTTCCRISLPHFCILTGFFLWFLEPNSFIHFVFVFELKMSTFL